MPLEVRLKSGFETLGTLGDETGLTCSMSVARKTYPTANIVPFAKFELAAQSTVAGQIDAFLVPAAYPHLNHFIMDSQLEVSEAFIAVIPALVVVGSPDIAAAAIAYHHPATEPLLAEVDLSFEASSTVHSNIEACKAIVERPDSIAITNSLCAEGFSLHIRKILRPGIKMPWILFVRNAKTVGNS